MPRSRMVAHRSSWWQLLVIAATAAVVSAGCSSSVAIDAQSSSSAPSVEAAPLTAATVPPTAADATSPASNRCRDDDSYRARLVETDTATGDVLTEYRYEVDDDHLRSEAADGDGGLVVLRGTEAWTFDSNGWEQLPAVPVRPLRTPWVNNFVTGPAVAQAATASDPDALYGLSVQRVVLTYEQFGDAFPEKIADTDYDPNATSFTYWLDGCDQIVSAQVTTTFGPATAELMGPDFPLTLDYLYESYDIGVTFPAVTPGEPVAPIPAPIDS